MFSLAKQNNLVDFVNQIKTFQKQPLKSETVFDLFTIAEFNVARGTYKEAYSLTAEVENFNHG